MPAAAPYQTDLLPVSAGNGTALHDPACVADCENVRAAVKKSRNTKGKTFGDALPVLRRIVEKKSYERIGGRLVDTFTASTVTQVYDALSEANRKKLDGFSFIGGVNACFKVLERARARA